MTAARVKALAQASGFDLCGIARAERHPKLARLKDWIALGYAGEMTYLADSLDERLDPSIALPTAKSIISLAVVYNTGQPYSTDVGDPERVAIARYAWGDDYHLVLRSRLRHLLAALAHAAGTDFEGLSCVDFEATQERVWAEAAGLGWIGKNTCVINPRIGSWFVLGEIITNAELEPDAPVADQCGTCTRCIEACPTQAIQTPVGPAGAEPYTVDATKCLSYLTIETRGEIDAALQPAVTTQLFGCDICQDVCPWNRKAAVSDDPAFQPRPGLAFPRLSDLTRMSDAEWSALIRDSAMKRAGLTRLRRTLRYLEANHTRV
ncbi:MAG: tRNA epoxyqueuosine(34) reductase QueG [Acidobacteria bacterium]|nr:MAG: tRNA epoxyqueuosine(34) reductase QueG [Acidobacteriota bacterium]